ncbi:MAG: MFS transporter [Alphaproteobacteria bacterium]|nr:MFS transporter [Alphaproteobacteria bacterium]
MSRLLILVVVSIATQAMTALIAFTTPLMAVEAAPDFGVAAEAAGLFMTVIFVVAMLSAAAGGGVIARFGAIRTTQLCLLLCAAGIVLMLPGSAPLALAGAMLIGAGYGPVTPASSHLLAPVTSERSRPFVFSVKQTAVPVGAACAGLLVPQMIGLGGWRAAVLAVAGIVLAVAAAVQPFRASYDADRNRSARLRLDIHRAVAGAFARPRLRELCLLSFAFAAVQLCFGAYFVTFLVERQGMTLVAAGIAFTVGQVCGIGFRILWGAVAERALSARVLLVLLAVLMAAASAATLALSPGWPLAAIAGLAALFGASAVAWNGLYLAEIVRVTSIEESAAVTGGALFFTFGGMTVGPAAFGAMLASGASYGVAFTVTGAVALLAALPLLRSDR